MINLPHGPSNTHEGIKGVRMKNDPDKEALQRAASCWRKPEGQESGGSFLLWLSEPCVLRLNPRRTPSAFLGVWPKAQHLFHYIFVVELICCFFPPAEANCWDVVARLPSITPSSLHPHNFKLNAIKSQHEFQWQKLHRGDFLLIHDHISLLFLLQMSSQWKNWAFLGLTFSFFFCWILHSAFCYGPLGFCGCYPAARVFCIADPGVALFLCCMCRQHETAAESPWSFLLFTLNFLRSASHSQSVTATKNRGSVTTLPINPGYNRWPAPAMCLAACGQSTQPECTFVVHPVCYFRAVLNGSCQSGVTLEEQFSCHGLTVNAACSVPIYQQTSRDTFCLCANLAPNLFWDVWNERESLPQTNFSPTILKHLFSVKHNDNITLVVLVVSSKAETEAAAFGVKGQSVSILIFVHSSSFPFCHFLTQKNKWCEKFEAWLCICNLHLSLESPRHVQHFPHLLCLWICIRQCSAKDDETKLADSCCSSRPTPQSWRLYTMIDQCRPI